MRKIASLSALAVLLALPELVYSQEKNRLADVRAVQEAMSQAIERAEPSIACVLVSRSEKYKAYAPVKLETPGELGAFDLREIARTRFRDENDPDYQALSRLDLSDPNNVPEAYGSGVVIDEHDGLILTMAHVVKNATKIYVRLPGGRGSWANVHALDSRSDLAILRLIDHMPDLKALKIGDGGKLRKADLLLSLANPFAAGFRDGSPSASFGIISNLRRRATGVLSDVPSSERNSRLPLYCFGTLIQTDTRTNLGCSGGALLNLNGELVGLSSALAGIAGGETPGGFAVPMDAAMKRILDVLRRGEEVEYGFLGVYLRPPNKMANGYVQILYLVEGGPADQGGIRGHYPPTGFRRRGQPDEGGDFILSIDGIPIHNNDELILVVGTRLAGSTVRIEVSNRPDGPRRFCSVTLGKIPSLTPIIVTKKPPARGGIRVDWASTLAPRIDSIPTGVVIREVLRDSAADRARLQPDMLLTKVNQHPVRTPAEFYHEMEKANGSVELTIATAKGGEESVSLPIK